MLPEVGAPVLPPDVVDSHSEEEGEAFDANNHTGEAPMVFPWAPGVVWDE